MTLPYLVQDGIEQYEMAKGALLTRLPKGLFVLGTGSMRCKLTIYLRVDNIQCVGDVYGSLQASLFRSFVNRNLTVLRLRDGVQPCMSRIPQSMTYLEAFGGEFRTSDACEFKRRVVKIRSGSFGRSRVQAYKAWASAMIRDRNTVYPTRWPSPEHEQAIFEEAIRYDWPWGPWPEVDHERVCYELMCKLRLHTPRCCTREGFETPSEDLRTTMHWVIQRRHLQQPREHQVVPTRGRYTGAKTLDRCGQADDLSKRLVDYHGKHRP